MGNNLIWIRGEIISQDQAFVNVLSPMAQFGLNVFEGIRCYWNEEQGELYAFRLNEHLHRLMESCKLLRFESPYTPENMVRYLKETIVANGFFTDTAVRLTMFVDGEGTWHTCKPISMFIAPIVKPRTNLLNIPGYHACISSWMRINDNCMPPRAKVGANYINGRYAHLQAKRDGYDLPIFLGEDGKVSEGAGACLFIVRAGKLVTPTTSSSILESITRDAVLQLAREMGWPVEERSIDRTELYLAEEVFLCGSAAEISPVVSIDGYTISNGYPGEKTKELLQQYLAVASGMDKRHSSWRTVIHHIAK